MIIVYTRKAENDLESIGDYIALDNPARALSFIGELRQCCQKIGKAPGVYAFVPRHQHNGIRRYVHGDYLIFYRIDQKKVEIIHILHGARYYEDILFSDV